MPSLFSSWMLPTSPQKCAAHNRNVTCNFALYSNASNLQEQQKLDPDFEFTGKGIVLTFIISTSMAIILSSALLVDRVKWHFWEGQYGEKGDKHRKFYLRLIYLIEKLLHALSDQQLVAGLALLVTLNRRACEISAYHYNLVCTMLILSAVTHLNSLISIPDFIFKGKTMAFYRTVVIVLQYILSIIALSARNTNAFPSKSSSLAILPAACFENMDAAKKFGLDDFFNVADNVTNTIVSSNSTSNTTDIWLNIKAAVAPSQGFGEYITLVVFLGIAAIFLLGEYVHTQRSQSLKHKTFGVIGIILSVSSIIASISIVSLVMTHYEGLRHGMEIDQWYQLKAAARQSPGFSVFLTILLGASGSITFVQAITESLAGHKGRRFIETVKRDIASAKTQRWVKAGQQSGHYVEMNDNNQGMLI